LYTNYPGVAHDDSSESTSAGFQTRFYNPNHNFFGPGEALASGVSHRPLFSDAGPSWVITPCSVHNRRRGNALRLMVILKNFRLQAYHSPQLAPSCSLCQSQHTSYSRPFPGLSRFWQKRRSIVVSITLPIGNIIIPHYRYHISRSRKFRKHTWFRRVE